MSLLSNIKAQKAIDIENYEDAIAICQSAILKNDKDVESLAMLAHCYEWKGDLEKANTIAVIGLQLDMTDFSLY